MNNSYICNMNSHNENNHRKPLAVLIHGTAWAVLFGLPFFFTGKNSETVTLESYIRFVIVPLSFMIVFYANYFLLINKYLFTKQIGHYITSNIVLIAAAVIGVHLIMRSLPEPVKDLGHWKPDTWDIILFFIRNTLFYILVSGLSVAIKMTGSWYSAETSRKELEKSRAEAELTNLKSQLNPHFLFNTLNNIYSLIAFSPERAQEAVHDLSRLLRYVLYESSQPFVPLSKEMDFLHNYVELMRIRLPEQVRISVDIPRPGTEGILIAPLLFISLIENAFKHGVSYSNPSFVTIRIEVEAGKEISCMILNSYFPKDSHDKSGSGIGLSNLHKRLDLLYPGRHTLRCERTADAYISELVLTLNPEDT